MAFDITCADETLTAPMTVLNRHEGGEIDLESAGLMLAYIRQHGDDPALEWILKDA